MKRLFIWLILIIASIAALILALPSLLSSDQIWARVSPILEEQVGRKITVSGERKLTLYPNIALVLGDVEVGSRISSDIPLASLETLSISVDLMSLFSGNINIKELTLDGADINLHVDENGQNNWADSAPTALPEQSNDENDPLGALIAESVNEPKTTVNTKSEFDLSTLKIQNFKIINSRITYEDQKTGNFELAENINIDIQLLNQNKGLTLSGGLSWQNQAIDFELTDFDIDNFINQRDADLNFTMNSAPVALSLVGQLHNGDNFGFDGNVALKSPSIRQIANWLKIDLSSVNDSAIDLKTSLDLAGSTYQFGDINLGIFGSQIIGALNVSNADTPNIYGKLAINQLNIDLILPASESAESSLNWSNEALDLSFLSQINSNVELSIGYFEYDGIASTQLEGALVIRKSTAKLPIKMLIFDGQISAEITAQLNNKGANISANIEAENINVENALKKLDITDKLAAIASMNVNVATSGASMAQFMSNLNGNGALVMADGVIKGIALADALAPEIANADLSLNSPEKLAAFALEAGKNLYKQNISSIMSNGFGQNVGAEKQTKFVKAQMTFTIDNGVLNNDDLEVASENIVIRGAGQVDIGKKSLNYRIIPKLLRKVENGTAERMTIPALITGPWSDPSVAIDYAYALENSGTINRIRDQAVQKITEQIKAKVTDKIINEVTKEIGKKVGEQAGEVLTEQVGNQIGQLLGLPSNNDNGGKEQAAEQKTDTEKLVDAGNLLNNLFNNSN